jgi:hypothetical protein
MPRGSSSLTTLPGCVFAFAGEGNYRFGFNGQEKVDEVNGSVGTHNTAEFWEYDTRTGRRWNLDPKPNPSWSIYSCFENSPIWHSDPQGDTISINLHAILFGLNKWWLWGASRMKKQTDDGVYVIYAHSNIALIDDNSEDTDRQQRSGHAVTTPRAWNAMMAKKVPGWKKNMERKKEMTVIIMGCNAGSSELVQCHGKDCETFEAKDYGGSIAVRISKEYANLRVIAPDGYLVLSGNIGDRMDASVTNHKGDAGFVTFKDGEPIDKTEPGEKFMGVNTQNKETQDH